MTTTFGRPFWLRSAEMPIVATAGHVDHGKSTLVEALTGTDPDRLREEKERGLTIDLGFAWTDIDGHDVGFVDVPGHERFIKNMLAGVGAVDCAMLVVAADSGWMPQTEEHAAVLDLLDIRRGVVAISRIDLVDDDTLELTTLEILDEVAGTALETWPVIAVSAPTGMGLDRLRAAIVESLEAAPPMSNAPARLWIDRSFTIAGSGQVVTGTMADGTIVRGDDLSVYPADRAVRVRGLQHHGAEVDRVRMGDRTAIDVVAAQQAPERGDLIAAPGSVDVSRRLLAVLSPTRHLDEIPRKGAFHLHIGTTSRSVRLRRIDGAGFLFDLDEPVPAAFGDRIIIRDAGRKAVVGGGRIIDTRPTGTIDPSVIDRLAAALDGDTDERASVLVDVHGVVTEAWVRATTRGGVPHRALPYPGGWVSRSRAQALAGSAHQLVSEYHEQHPTRVGMPKAELASKLDVESALLDVVVELDDDLEERTGAVGIAGFSNELSEDEERRWDAVREDMERGFDVPRLRSLDLTPETLHFLLRRGDLVRIADDLAFTAKQVEIIDERVKELPDGFTVADFRDHFSMARRQAVPTLEWLDSTGRTRRSGDGRSVRDR